MAQPSIRISIVTPCLNYSLYLEEAITSVLSQDYFDFEHIIVDGGSSDHTLNILRRYAHLQWVSEPIEARLMPSIRGSG
jgi:glycosyltransferase involved in cell wall biosynthesis